MGRAEKMIDGIGLVAIGRPVGGRLNVAVNKMGGCCDLDGAVGKVRNRRLGHQTCNDRAGAVAMERVTL